MHEISALNWLEVRPQSDVSIWFVSFQVVDECNQFEWEYIDTGATPVVCQPGFSWGQGAKETEGNKREEMNCLNGKEVVCPSKGQSASRSHQKKWWSFKVSLCWLSFVGKWSHQTCKDAGAFPCFQKDGKNAAPVWVCWDMRLSKW